MRRCNLEVLDCLQMAFPRRTMVLHLGKARGPLHSAKQSYYACLPHVIRPSRLIFSTQTYDLLIIDTLLYHSNMRCKDLRPTAAA